MTIKSLLIGSAAAVVAASSAQAADAIVAADPEPVEYVQVCQDFGTGYFYIPGTETCLKIGGFVRAQYLYNDINGVGNVSTSNFQTEAEIQFDAKTSTELGTLASKLVLESFAATADSFTNVSANTTYVRNTQIDEAHISLGDGNVFNIGYNASIADVSIGGEQIFDKTGSEGNQVQYKVAMDSATFYVQAVATQDNVSVAGDVAARIDFTAGDLGVKAFVGYDGDVAVASGGVSAFGAVGASVQLSYMGFGAYYQWSEKANSGSFGTGANNVYGASYSFDASDKLAIAAGIEFADGIGNNSAADAFGATLQLDYTIVSGLVAQALFGYADFNAAAGNADTTSVRLRLTRSF